MAFVRSKQFEIVSLSLCILLLIASWSLAQVAVLKPIDLGAKLATGSLSATVEPPFTKNGFDKIFDGNPFSEAAIQNSDSLTITLLFSSPISLGKSKVFFWNNGHWTLEAADSQEDLKSGQGTYQLLVAQRPYLFFGWDSSSFAAKPARIIRLRAFNPEYQGIYLGEWMLFEPYQIVALQIVPSPIQIIPGTSLTLKLNQIDNQGNISSYNLKDAIYWNTSDQAIATVDELGVVTGIALGTTSLTVDAGNLHGATTVTVVPDFKSTNAAPLHINVAVVLQDPVIDKANNRRIHQVRNWTPPMTLIYQLQEEFNQTSDGVVQFDLVEIHDDQFVFTRLDGKFMTIDTLSYYYGPGGPLYGREIEGTLQNLAEKYNRVRFDYNAMIDYYDFANKRNQNIIHEVWVYAPPFGGMYESQLVGPNAFWYNSPPLNHPGLNKLLSVMGWNYERGIAEAMESFGHRSESALVHAFGDRWNVHATNPTAWEIFTRIDKDFPGGAHVGNIHFPPNGLSDYDYSNRRYVITYADNWKRYPILLNQNRRVNCEEWGYTHRGYLHWWFSHLPRFSGVTDGVLNNWWHYIVDFEEAVTLANQLSRVEPATKGQLSQPSDFRLGQNYPNPFNRQTIIGYQLPEKSPVKITIYDQLGRQIAVIQDDWQAPGAHTVRWDARDCASGLYFYKLVAGEFTQTRKMLLIK
ncbi:MAG: T9SS type A sorting domain-containing protein [candidate division KSB1 bacterium]|nr:T9SS type A sorting domain-containing protein [candidate division KSB1 bacterium]MDZ7317611.1 T9SS type A sorting domain-containing protein [candidate division KSB1 bacterium]MDZ7340292.1 T9SS type A sorting domain-containing protein [candidate division KSB1 bacterium]